MLNFTYYNPVKIVFGRDTIAQLPDLIPAEARVMMTWGGGSIKRNGVYDQVVAALGDAMVGEFGGIEPNPEYTTCIQAAEEGRRLNADFLLSVGGGSVLDGTKLIAVALAAQEADPWQLVTEGGATIQAAVPFGAVLTLPATGSEMNTNSVISRSELKQKLAFSSPLVFPRFSILDPVTTFTLPERQTANGIVDAFVHVMEQYLTYPVNAPLQDRQAEAIVLTLIEEAPKVMAEPHDYDARANIMWAATNALNNSINRGVPQDWSTHMIGHELTALYGIDHARTLAIVMPGMLRHRLEQKKAKILQLGRRVWHLDASSEDEACEQTIRAMEQFFESLGVPTHLSDYDVPPDAAHLVARRLDERGMVIGEHGDIRGEQVAELLATRA